MAFAFWTKRIQILIKLALLILVIPARAAITVTNTIEGETVSTELVLLRGTVDSTVNSVTIRNLSHNIDTIAWPAAAGYFKTAILLREGSNVLELTAEDQETKHITVMYNPLTEDDTPHFTRIMYVLPSDWQTDDNGRFQAPDWEDNSQESAIKRLKLGGLMMQTVTADLMEQEGMGKQTFRLERDQNGEVKVTIHESDWDFATMTSYNSTLDLMIQMKEVEIKRDYSDWRDAGVAMTTPVTRYLGGLVSPDIECYNDCDNIQAGEAWGGAGPIGGDYIGGGIVHSANFFAWAEALPEVPGRFADDRNPYDYGLYRGRTRQNYPPTIGMSYGISLGSLLHEAGHGWGLAHSTGVCGVMKSNFEKVLFTFMATNPQGEAIGSREDENFCWEPPSMDILQDTPHFADVVPLALSPDARTVMRISPLAGDKGQGVVYNIRGKKMSLSPDVRQAPGVYFRWKSIPLKSEK